jgi:O-Antigen ligase
MSLFELITAAITVGCGAALVASPIRAIGATVGVLAATALVLLPLQLFAPAVVTAAALLPPVLLEARVNGISLSATPISGQARLLALLLAVCTAKWLMTKRQLRIPAVVGVAAAVYTIGLLFSVVVAFFRQTDYPEIAGDISRQLMYVLATAIGAISFTSTRTLRERLQFYRALGSVALIVYALSLAYWAWTVDLLHRQLPGVERLFKDVRASSVYTPHRSIFPFVDDSPNLSAVIFVIIGAFVIPPLIVDERRWNRRLGAAVAVGMVSAVLTTQSRTGIAALAVAPVSLALFRSSLPRRRLILGLTVVALLAGLAYHEFPNERRLSTRAQTFQARESLWAQALRKVDAHPYVGEGYRYSARANFIEALPSSSPASPSARLQSVHSDYLGAAVDGGIIGAAALAALMLLLLRLVLRAVRRSGFPRRQGIGFLCAFSSLTVAMLTSSIFQSAGAQIIIWLFAGIVGAGTLVEDD